MYIKNKYVEDKWVFILFWASPSHFCDLCQCIKKFQKNCRSLFYFTLLCVSVDLFAKHAHVHVIRDMQYVMSYNNTRDRERLL